MIKVKNRSPYCLPFYSPIHALILLPCSRIYAFLSRLLLFHKHQIAFSPLVTLLHPQLKDKKVGKGTVVKRPKVHGHTIKEGEVAVLIDAMIGYNYIQHPNYSYDVEAGGYIAWEAALCQLTVNSETVNLRNQFSFSTQQQFTHTYILKFT